MEERLLTGPSTDGQNSSDGWRDEAMAVINDVKSFVNEISICENLPCNESGIYFNVETKEGTKLTVELSTGGFRICGLTFDNINSDPLYNSIHYETIYALLGFISPGYRESFSSSLAMKLNALLPPSTGHTPHTSGDHTPTQ